VSALAQASYCRRYGFADTSTIDLTAFWQVAQADQDIDLAGAKRRRKQPNALAHARLVSGLPLTMTRAFGILA
jgi:hypothetical protein